MFLYNSTYFSTQKNPLNRNKWARETKRKDGLELYSVTRHLFGSEVAELECRQNVSRKGSSPLLSILPEPYLGCIPSDRYLPTVLCHIIWMLNYLRICRLKWHLTDQEREQLDFDTG